MPKRRRPTSHGGGKQKSPRAQRAELLARIAQSSVEIESTEEVGVGAYARRQTKRRMLLGGTGLGLVLLAALIYWLLAFPASTSHAETFTVHVRCMVCDYDGRIAVPLDESFPVRCPRCRNLGCVMVWECLDCGEQFTPRPRGDLARCPKCGSLRVGSQP